MQENYDYPAPRPYAWKTDEYQTQNEPRPPKVIAQAEPLIQPNAYGNQNYAGQPLAYSGPQYMAGNYRCPNCGTQYLPVIERRISTAGWITFAVLLFITMGFLCWIGLLIKEDVSICPICRTKVS